MSINKVVIAGTFSFPFGEAASSRIKNLALGFKEQVSDTSIVALYHNDNTGVYKANGLFSSHGMELPYHTLLPHINESSNAWKRITRRFAFLLSIKKLKNRVVSQLRGDEQELLFLYGRSYLFINSLLHTLNKLNYKTKVVFDVVEPPRTQTSVTEYVLHPFVWDSVLIYKKLLHKLDGCTFITYKLQEEFSGRVKNYQIVPSVTYKTEIQETPQPSGSVVRIGYVGLLVDKDHPALLYSLCEEFARHRQPFRLLIIGRFRNFAEGRQWEKKFNESDFRDSVEFHFDPDEETKNNLLRSIDFIALFRKPDRVQEYTFPTRAVETLALGKVLLLNEFGDLKRYFRDMENCIMITAEPATNNVVKIVRMTDPVLYSQVVRSSSVLLKKDFNAGYQTKMLLKLF